MRERILVWSAKKYNVRMILLVDIKPFVRRLVVGNYIFVSIVLDKLFCPYQRFFNLLIVKFFMGGVGEDYNVRVKIRQKCHLPIYAVQFPHSRNGKKESDVDTLFIFYLTSSIELCLTK